MLLKHLADIPKHYQQSLFSLFHPVNVHQVCPGQVKSYPYPGTVDGYNAAGASYSNEFVFESEEIAGEGKHLFVVYCAVCHGESGDGQGHLVQIDKFPPPPSYFRDDIMVLPEGKRYHAVMYGKGLMGSYATQLDHRERWLVLSYVQSLQDKQAAKTASN